MKIVMPRFPKMVLNMDNTSTNVTLDVPEKKGRTLEIDRWWSECQERDIIELRDDSGDTISTKFSHPRVHLSISKSAHGILSKKFYSKEETKTWYQ